MQHAGGALLQRAALCLQAAARTGYPTAIGLPRSNDDRDSAFDVTRWDLIRLARDEDPAESSRRRASQALNELCEIYRGPVLAYLYRRTVTPQDAEDLAQEFFSRRICPDLVPNAAAGKGRFRALLLVSLKNFVRDQVARERAEKRGGKVKFVPLQDALPSASAPTADDLSFDTCWAKTVVARALERMRRSHDARAETATFDVLAPFISDPAGGAELAPAALRLGLTINALQVRLSRFRASYAKHVREELARTVASADQIEPEVRYLLDVLSAAR